MPDFADIGGDYTERWLTAKLEEHAYQSSHNPPAFEIGRCRNCEEKTDDSRSFCDENCRADYQARQAAEKRNGKRVISE